MGPLKKLKKIEEKQKEPELKNDENRRPPKPKRVVGRTAVPK